MFSLPGLPEIDAEIAKEKGLLFGAEFINSSSQLSPNGRKEVQEEIQYCKTRIERFTTLRNIVEILHNMKFSERPNQFASEEVINEFKKHIETATLVLNDFKAPVKLEIKVTEV